MSAAPEVSPQNTAPSTAAFDRAAAAILGTMLTLIVVLTVLLVTESVRAPTDPPSTAQTDASPHRA